MNYYDAIVVGVGGMGSATLYHLARRGLKVLGIEQFDLGHALGSSHGQTRIVRRAYFEDTRFVPLVMHSYALWEELQAEAAEVLMSQCGLVVAGDPRGDIISGSRDAAAKHGLDLVEFSADEARKRFDGFVFDDGMDVLLDPKGGYLHVERCVTAHIAAAVRSGATVVSDVPVVSWTADAGGATIVTAKERYSAEKLLFTCGAWASFMLGSAIPPLDVQRTLMGWFDAPDRPYAEAGGFPVFGFDTPEGFFYGFPKLDARGMKVAAHFGTGSIASPGDLDRERRDTDFDGVSAFIRRHLPAASPAPNDFAVCMYTMSSDGVFIVDRHPEHDNVFFAAGFSGHGFKFCPGIGANLAEFCTTGRRPASLAFLSASRFARSQ